MGVHQGFTISFIYVPDTIAIFSVGHPNRHLCMTRFNRDPIQPIQPSSVGFRKLKVLEICHEIGDHVHNAGFLDLLRWTTFNTNKTSMTLLSIEILIIHGQWIRCTRENQVQFFRHILGGKAWTTSSTVCGDRFPRLSAVHFKLNLEYSADPTVTPDSTGLKPLFSYLLKYWIYQLRSRRSEARPGLYGLY